MLAGSNRLALLAYAVGFVGVFEELCKMLPFVAIIVRLCPFSGVIDGIIYASASALGYASTTSSHCIPLSSPRLLRAIGAVWFLAHGGGQKLHEAHRGGQGSIQREDCDDPAADGNA